MGNTITNVNMPPEANEIVNNILNNISLSSSSTCEASGANAQTITFGKIKTVNCDETNISNFNQGINTKVTAQCIQSSDFSNMIDSIVNQELMAPNDAGWPRPATEAPAVRTVWAGSHPPPPPARGSGPPSLPSRSTAGSGYPAPRACAG